MKLSTRGKYGSELGVNYRVLKGAASHVIAKTCITDV